MQVVNRGAQGDIDLSLYEKVDQPTGRRKEQPDVTTCIESINEWGRIEVLNGTNTNRFPLRITGVSRTDHVPNGKVASGSRQHAAATGARDDPLNSAMTYFRLSLGCSRLRNS